LSDGHEIAMALRSAYWAMHRRADALLLRDSTTADQFVLLSLLADEDGITQQQLVRRASSDANTIRAMLVLLERRGLVSRRRHPTDGRARSVVLTTKGRRIYERLRAGSESFRRRLFLAVGQCDAESLIECLMRITTAMSPKSLDTDRARQGAAL
jgi:DNA-binding MarR family transcriptional regulator